MSIPISNAMKINITKKNNFNTQLYNLNRLKFTKPSIKNFPLLSIISVIPEKHSLFETILISINDYLVEKYLNNQINYTSINKNLLKFIKSKYFSKYYKLVPKNIYDIKKMIKLTKNYLDLNIKYYEN